MLTALLLVPILVAQLDDRTTGAENPEVHQGLWCASLTSPGGKLAFGLEIRVIDTTLEATIVNGSERINVPSTHLEKGQLVLEIPHYDAILTGTLSPQGDRMGGEWRKRSGADRWTSLPFAAGFSKNGSCDATAARAPDEPTVDGRWAVKFSSSEDPAVGVFHATATHAVEGTFLSTTGDYRYLAGTFVDGRLRLSCFDGAHAFLFDAHLQDDGTLKGDFWSGDRWHETWTATRDAQAELPDTFGRAHWNEDIGLASLCFPDLDGKERSLADPEFAGRARILQVLGSWCPNCHDETHYLAELDKRYRSRGLSIVGLSFELTGDFERDAEQVRRTAKRHGAEYPMLLAGLSDREKAHQAIPALAGLLAFPTTIFLHADGRVRAIHSGFAGPGTGEEYTKLGAEFEKIVEELLAEPPPDDAAVWKELRSDNWRDERDRVIVEFQRDTDGRTKYIAWEALRFDRPTKRDPLATGDVAISGTSVRIGPDLYQLDRRAGVLLDPRDVGHRLTPATRSPAPLVDGKSYWEPEPMLAAVQSTDPVVRRDAIVYLTLQIAKHMLEVQFDPTPALADPDLNVRCAAAWSAGQLKAAGAGTVLIESLANGYAPLRREAARALGKIGSKEAVAGLNALTHDLDPLVREAAKDSLTKLSK
jgi:thiol-disulfide isomerase/thioredoxin